MKLHSDEAHSRGGRDKRHIAPSSQPSPRPEGGGATGARVWSPVSLYQSRFRGQQQFYDKVEFIQQLNICLSVRFSWPHYSNPSTHSVLFSTQRELRQAELLQRLPHTFSISASPFPPFRSSALSRPGQREGTDDKDTELPQRSGQESVARPHPAPSPRNPVTLRRGWGHRCAG